MTLNKPILQEKIQALRHAAKVAHLAGNEFRVQRLNEAADEYAKMAAEAEQK